MTGLLGRDQKDIKLERPSSEKKHFTQLLGFDLKIATQLSHPKIQLGLGKNLN